MCSPNKMPKRYSTRRRAPRRKFPRRKAKFPRRKATRGISRKRILEITSVKKRDTMRFAVKTALGWVPQEDIRGVRLTIPGASNGFYSGIWCPTYRQYDNGTVEQARNSRTVYWKGVSEKMRIETGSQSPVELRRIVFSVPDKIQLASGAAATDQPSYGLEVDQNRYYRTSGDGSMNINYLNLVFSGQRPTDWCNPMTAKTDTKRVRIHSDKRMKIASGNSSPGVKEMKFYDALNRNMTYDDDELGGEVVTSGWAETSRFGQQMNVYVLILMMGVGDNATPKDGNVWMDIESTVYWHER